MNYYFDLFDGLFDSMFGQTITTTGGKAVEKKYSVPAFPPCKAYVDKEGNMNFEFALAGYKKEDLKIDFDENRLVLSTVEDYKEEVMKDTKLLANNIKKPSFKYVYGVPETKFKFDETSATFEDGILTVVIPPLEKKEHKVIKIN